MAHTKKGELRGHRSVHLKQFPNEDFLKATICFLHLHVFPDSIGNHHLIFYMVNKEENTLRLEVKQSTNAVVTL